MGFMIFWIIGNATNCWLRLPYVWLWLCRSTLRKARKWNMFSASIFRDLVISNVDLFGKDAYRKSLRSVFSDPENLEYGIDLFKKTWSGNSVFSKSIERTSTFDIFLSSLKGFLPPQPVRALWGLYKGLRKIWQRKLVLASPCSL